MDQHMIFRASIIAAIFIVVFSSEDEKNDSKFKPSKEWQVVKKGI